MLYVIIVICLPRIYVGIHYPSDVLAGAALGVFCVLLCSWSKIRQAWTGALVLISMIMLTVILFRFIASRGTIKGAS